MQTLAKPLAVLLAAIGLAVLFHFVLGTLYRDVIESEDVWQPLNWFMAFGVIVALVVTYLDKRTVARDSADTNTYIHVNVWFYTAAALSILFFWNWVNEMVVGGGSEGQTNSNYWVLIDVLFPILMARMSVRLWQDSSR